MDEAREAKVVTAKGRTEAMVVGLRNASAHQPDRIVVSTAHPGTDPGLFADARPVTPIEALQIVDRVLSSPDQLDVESGAVRTSRTWPLNTPRSGGEPTHDKLGAIGRHRKAAVYELVREIGQHELGIGRLDEDELPEGVTKEERDQVVLRALGEVKRAQP